MIWSWVSFLLKLSRSTIFVWLKKRTRMSLELASKEEWDVTWEALRFSGTLHGHLHFPVFSRPVRETGARLSWEEICQCLDVTFISSPNDFSHDSLERLIVVLFLKCSNAVLVIPSLCLLFFLPLLLPFPWLDTDTGRKIHAKGEKETKKELQRKLLCPSLSLSSPNGLSHYFSVRLLLILSLSIQVRSWTQLQEIRAEQGERFSLWIRRLGRERLVRRGSTTRKWNMRQTLQERQEKRVCIESNQTLNDLIWREIEWHEERTEREGGQRRKNIQSPSLS